MQNNKTKFAALGGIIAAIIVVLVISVTRGKGGDNTAPAADSSLPAVTVVSGDGSKAPEQTAASSAADSSSLAVTDQSSSDSPQDASSAAVTDSSKTDGTKEYKQYKFRSKKLYNDHYEKHGSEFGSITKEEYLKLANDLLNSDSETVLHKTEKEDGDDVYFDTATGYFLVLSKDGYIRTFFIPQKGIEYYNKQ